MEYCTFVKPNTKEMSLRRKTSADLKKNKLLKIEGSGINIKGMRELPKVHGKIKLIMI